MNIRINGKDETIDSPVSIAELVSGKALLPDAVAVEHNLRIVSKEEWAETMVQENDTIEIIGFFGGG